MTHVINFNTLNLATEIGSSFGMLILTIGALLYAARSRDRVLSWTFVFIFLTLIIAFSCQAVLSIFDLQNRRNSLSQKDKVISNLLYAGQFFFQWLSLLIFTLEYLSTEQEVRKVLGLKSTKRKREIVAAISVSILTFAVIFTYLVCQWAGVSYFDSWASSLGESCVAGALVFYQGVLIKQIHKTIKMSDLDLVPVTKTFCANLSIIGFIFLVQCGELAIHIITGIFSKKSQAEKQQSNSTPFLILTLTIQVALIFAYFGFFLLIFRATHGGRTFDDLILH